MYDDFAGMITGDDDFEEEDEYLYAIHGTTKPSNNTEKSSIQSTTHNASGPSVSHQYGQHGMPDHSEQRASHSNVVTDAAADFDPESVCTNSVESGSASAVDVPALNSKSSGYMDKAPVVYLEDAVDFEKVTVQGSIQLQVDIVPEGILQNIDTFFCCATCGKVFWEGKHFSHICSQFADVIERSMDRQGRQHGTQESEV